MTITITWDVTDIERHEETDMVYNIHLSVEATNGTRTISDTMLVGIEPNTDAAAFTPFVDLTKDQVLTWAFSQINKAAVEEILTRNLGRTADSKATGTPW